jgi:hypothetical protein
MSVVGYLLFGNSKEILRQANADSGIAVDICLCFYY